MAKVKTLRIWGWIASVLAVFELIVGIAGVASGYEEDLGRTFGAFSMYLGIALILFVMAKRKDKKNKEREQLNDKSK